MVAVSQTKSRVAALAEVRETRVLANAATRLLQRDRARAIFPAELPSATLSALHVLLELLQFADDLVEPSLEVRVRAAIAANRCVTRTACGRGWTTTTRTAAALAEAAWAWRIAGAKSGAVESRALLWFGLTILWCLYA